MLLNKSLVYPLLGLILFVALGTSIADYLLEIRTLKSVHTDNDIRRARDVHLFVQTLIDEKTDKLEALAYNVSDTTGMGIAFNLLELPGGQTRVARLLDRVGRTSKVDVMYALDQYGVPVYSSAQDIRNRQEVKHSVFPVLGEALMGKIGVSAEEVDDTLVLFSSAPVKNKGEVLGAIALGVSLNNAFVEEIANKIGEEVVLVTQGEEVAQSLSEPLTSLFPQADSMNNGQLVMEPGASIACYRNTVSVAGRKIDLYVILDVSGSIASLSRAKSELFKSSLLFVLIAVFFGSIFAYRLITPLRRLRKNSVDITREITGREVKNAAGNEVRTLVHSFGVMAAALTRRIRDLEEAEKTILQSGEEYRSIFENITDVFFRTDTEGVFQVVSPSGLAFLGADKPEDVVGHKAREFCLDETIMKRTRERLLQNKYVNHVEIEFRTFDGRIVSCEANLRALFDEEGTFIGVEGVSRDITERKRVEDQLRESTKFLNTVFDAIQDGISVLDRNLNVIRVNKRMEAWFGRDVDILGKTCPLASSPHACPSCLAKKTMESQVPERGECRQQVLSGEVLDLEIIAFPLFGVGGELRGIVEYIRDATQQKKARTILQEARDELEENVQQRTEELNRAVVSLQEEIIRRQALESHLVSAKEAAEEASRAKSEFLANMSHEIRTPLNGVIGMTELGLESSPDEAASLFGIINHEAVALLNVITDILDFSKIEAGKMEIEHVDFDLREFMDDFASCFGLQAEQKGLVAKCYMTPDVPAQVCGDPARLRQVLVNITSNALKFTHKGDISIMVSLEDETDSSATVLFSVRDTGIGIPPEKQRLIFESFTQADGSVSRRFGGTGLGTTIAKQFVEMMGGEIGVTSELGEGSLFRFTICLQKQSSRGLHANTPLSRSGNEASDASGTILLVEDYPTNQQVAIRHLTRAGYSVDVAENGRVATELYSVNTYDMILMDIQMPEMDGLAATQIIREMERDSGGRRTPVIAMTAHAISGYRERCLEAEMDDYIAKPLLKNDLLAMVAKWVGAVDMSGEKKRPEPEYSEQFSPAQQNVPFDYNLALREFEGDTGFLWHVIKGFRKQLDEQHERIQAALGNEDCDAIAAEGHAIKGGAGNLMAVPLSVVGSALEQAGKNRDLKQCELLLGQLQQEIVSFEQYIDSLRKKKVGSAR